MNVVLLQIALNLQELKQLNTEFPQFLFLSFPHATLQPIPTAHWPRVEILFGGRLSADELSLAPEIRWIHAPSTNLTRLCLKEITEKGNLLVTDTRDENIHQIGEYAIAGILAFSKNLFLWRDANRHPGALWDSKGRSTMWSLKERTLLQIGTGPAGREIARQAAHFEMKVWGMDVKKTFFPYSQKNFSFEELTEALPHADVVSVSLPRAMEYKNILNVDTIRHLKEDAILILTGGTHAVTEEALLIAIHERKLRGALLDAAYQTPVPTHSPIWSAPNLILTPEVAPRPKDTEREAFRLFRTNLRHYVRGNFYEMRNLVDTAVDIAFSEDFT